MRIRPFRKFLYLTIVTVLAQQNIFITPLSASESLIEIKSTINSGNDDAEERADGSMYFDSSDIELCEDNNQSQTVGLRFTDIDVIQGAQIEEAYLQFTTDTEVSTGSVAINIRLEAVDNSNSFQNSNHNLTNRPLSNTSILWEPENWNTIGEKAAPQKTPDLKSLLQEIVDRPGWSKGNSLSFIISGTGSRIAASYNLNSTQAAELIIKIASPPISTTLIENVYINEIMSSNFSYHDEYGEADDWFEIFNDNDEDLHIGGWYLTDNPSNLSKYQIPIGTFIEAHGHLVFWADDQSDQGDTHTNFKLKSDGEFLALVQELDNSFHLRDNLIFPTIPQNVSFGRSPDGSSQWELFGAASPGFSNSTGGLYLEAPIEFSHEGGFYESGFQLQITSSDPAVFIHYTLDGSTPTINDALYTAPIEINETQVVLAKAFKDGYGTIQSESEFYVINDPAEIAVLNIQSAPDNFWDDETGIYVAGTNGIGSYCSEPKNWNQDWERSCRLTFYEPDGTEGFKVNAGMKIGGACSRNLKMKSFNFFMRNSDYGDKEIDYQIFPNVDVDKFRRIKVRNSGGDWAEMMFRDGMNSLILNNTMDLDLMGYRPVRVYINGEYWGVYGLREMFNKHYAASHHGVDADEVDVLGDPYGPNPSLREGDFDTYEELETFINNNSLEDDANYQKAQNYIDLQQYINYHIAQIYFASFDWPGNNVRVWRDKNQGKFRWMLFDTDASTGWVHWGESVCGPTHNTIEHMLNDQPAWDNVPGFEEWPNGAESTLLFRKLMANSSFRSEFIQRVCTYSELVFNPERVIPMVDSVENLLEPEMNRHISTWLERSDEFGNNVPSGGSLRQWQIFVGHYRNFFRNRRTNMISHIQSTLENKGIYTLTINYDESTNGEVVIHQNEMSVPYHYEGEYLKSIPIKIKAIPAEGYSFSHWEEISSRKSEIDFVGNTDQTLTPVFAVSGSIVVSDIQDAKNDFKLFPNPVKDQLTIETSINQTKVTIYNLMGEEVYHHPIVSSGSHTVDLSYLHQGIYVIMVRTREGLVLTDKIQVQ